VAELRRRGLPCDTLPDDEGPFSLHRPGALLAEAGWSDVRCTPHRLTTTYGGGLDPAAAAVTALDFGPIRLVTAKLGGDDLAAVTAAIADAFADHVNADGHVELDASIVVVTARA
jgi:hypothetical protein